MVAEIGGDRRSYSAKPLKSLGGDDLRRYVAEIGGDAEIGLQVLEIIGGDAAEINGGDGGDNLTT